MAAEDTDLESWENIAGHRIAVRRYFADGRKEHEVVHPGGTLVLTAQERRLNQSGVSRPGYDCFTNGCFRRVDVRADHAGEPLAAGSRAAANVNEIADDEFEEFVNEHWKKFEARVNKIDSPTTLHRILVACRHFDSGPKRIQIVSDRLREIDPAAQLVGDFAGDDSKIGPREELERTGAPVQL